MRTPHSPIHMKLPHDCLLGMSGSRSHGEPSARVSEEDRVSSMNPGPYSHPEAYDIINAPGTPEEVNGLERLFARVVLGLPRVADAKASRSLTWLEPCAGSGRFVRVIASRMARDGAQRASARTKESKPGKVIGIDLDPGMVAYASGRIAQLRLERHAAVVRADIRRFTARSLAKPWKSRTPLPIDAAFCLHNSIRHMTTERDLLAHLRAVAKVLSKRGAYAVGVELTPPEQMMTSESVFVGTRAGVRVREVFNYLPPEDHFAPEPMETVMTHLEMSRERLPSSSRGRKPTEPQTAELIAEWSTTYHLRCWSLEDWQRLVQKAGLHESGVFDSWGEPLNPTYRRYALRVLQRA